MKVVVLIQARTDSTRLPGKVLKSLLGKPMIINQIERVKRTKDIEDTLVITSDESSDDELSTVVNDFDYRVFRGSKENVLKRYYDAALSIGMKNSDIIVRLTGDCPLSDPNVIETTIEEYLEKKVDFLSNMITPQYPDGFDASVFSFKTLKYAVENVTSSYDKEHVVPFIKRSGLFTVAGMDLIKEYHPEWKLSVDTLEDFNKVESIFNNFGHNRFSLQDVVTFLESSK